MSIKGWCDKHLFHVWDENKLLSRKWLLVLGFVLVAVGLDIAGRALGEPTLTTVRDVVIAYVGVQGAIDYFRYRQGRSENSKKQPSEEDEQ